MLEDPSFVGMTIQMRNLSCRGTRHPGLSYLYLMPTISQLFTYPIKSLGGVSLTEAEVTDRGFKYDRRWMLVDDQNEFMSQRSIPNMALLQVSIRGDGLFVQHKKTGENVAVPFQPSGETVRIKVWSFEGKAVEVNGQVSTWFSSILNKKCKLVYMPDTTRRRVDSRYVSNKELTAFTDDFPYLAIGQSSLDHLNSKLEIPVPIDRFRPNVVFTGATPYEEDEWAHFTINQLNFFGSKLCGRCTVTTINQQEGVQGKEPLRTLATYRALNKKIYFGQYLVHDGEGVVRIGDNIQILETKKPRLPKVS